MIALISKVHIKRFCEQCSAQDVLYWVLLVSLNGVEGNEQKENMEQLRVSPPPGEIRTTTVCCEGSCTRIALAR